MDRKTRVLLCVSGGIAAYKAPEIVRAFVREGVEVQVIITPAAAAFVTELSLATVSGRPVRTTLLDAAQEGSVGHIELADWPDVVVVAPATANVMARAAAGLADDLVATCLLATQAPVLWAPAMNTNMWRHPATRQTLATLAARGAHFVGPDAGDLACGWVGEGRMIDPGVIVTAAQTLLSGGAHNGPALGGRRIMVSAGPTRAYLDPVRFFTNASTGAMGFAVAAVASALGAEVTLVAGPVGLETPPGVTRIDVETADAMLTAMDDALHRTRHDLVAMVAAVSDLTPSDTASAKIAKADLAARIRSGVFARGVDVLTTLTQRHRDRTVFLGFGAETVDTDVEPALSDALVRAGAAKLRAKRCHALFVNRVGAPGVGFGSPTNGGVLLVDNGDAEPTAIHSGPPIEKRALAGWILGQVAPLLSPQESP